MTTYLQHAQGATTWGVNQSGVGVIASAVTVSNSDGIVGKYVLLAKPRLCALVLGVLATGATAPFTPDVIGGYQVGLFRASETNFDPRNALAKLDFLVPPASGLNIPCYRSSPETFRPTPSDTDLADALEAIFSTVAAITSYTVPIVAGDVTLTAAQSTVDEIVLGGSPAGSFTTTIDVAATRPPGTPLKVRNTTAHLQYIADRNGNVWIVGSYSVLLEWIGGANPALQTVGVLALGGALLDSGGTPGVGTAPVSDGIGNASWTPVAQAGWSWFKVAMADANQTPAAPNDQCAVYYCTGALTADRDLVLPLTRRVVFVINATTGGHNVNIKGASGTAAVAAAGPAFAFCDGANFTFTP